jgi:hypothetical protein
MNIFKNGKIATLEPTDQSALDEAKDIRYYVGIHGNSDAGRDPRRYLLGCIEQNSDRVRESFDRAIWFLWKRRYRLDAEALSLLSFGSRSELLQELIIEQSDTIPYPKRLKYRGRFKRVLARCGAVAKLRDKVLCRFLAEPNDTWLRELTELNELIVSAQVHLDELMSCEHKGYRRLFHSPKT